MQSCGCAVMPIAGCLKKKRRNRGGCVSQGDPLLHSIEAALHTQVIHKMESCKHDLIGEVHRLGKLAMVVDSLRLYVPSIVLLSISPRHLYNRRHNVSFASIKYTLTSKIFSPPLLLISLYATMDRQVALKVPVPRLPARVVEPKRSKKQVDRLHSAACSNCRRRKIRCNGRRPQCNNCTARSAPCVYAQARRDRLKEYVPPRSLC
jgi:hypothetical protein